jgi:hypothetical protein
VTAESGIEDESSAVDRHRQHHVRQRGFVPPPQHDDASGVHGWGEPQLRQRRLDDRAVLEAVAASTRSDQLVLHRREIDPHTAAQEHVEVLEWDRAHVRTQHAGERVERRRSRAAPTDSSQISIEIERRHRCRATVTVWAGRLKGGPCVR